ncbi:stem-specific protein TSJT1-like, partial [Trifolium pratense]
GDGVQPLRISGCLFHSEHGLLNFEHPTKKMKAMPRIDSEGVMCGGNFNVDSRSRNQMMPRVELKLIGLLGDRHAKFHFIILS